MKGNRLVSTAAAFAFLVVVIVAASPLVVPIIYTIMNGGLDSLSIIAVGQSAFDGYPSSIPTMFQEPYLETTLLYLLAFLVLGAVAALAGRIRDIWERRTEYNAPIENSKVYTGLGVLPHVRTWKGDATPKRAGIALGSLMGRQIVWPGVHSCIVSASGGGKSRCMVIPTAAMLMQEESHPNMLFTDPSLELYAYLKPLAEGQGYEVSCIDLKEPSRSDSVDFLGTIKACLEQGSIGDAQKAAESLGAMLSPLTDGDNAIFGNVAQQIISAIAFGICFDPVIPDAMRSMASVADTARVLTSHDPEELKHWIRGYGDDSPISALCPSLLSAEGKELAAFIVNAHDALSPFATDDMKRLTQPEGALSMSDIPRKDGKPKAVFVRTLNPGEKDNRLVALLLQQLWSETERQGQSRGQVRPLYALLDEYASLAQAADWGVESCVQKARKYGFHLSFIVQNLDGLAPGNEATMNTILGNCSTIALYSTTDQRTAEYFEKLFGQKAVLTKNTGSAAREETLLSESQGYSEQNVPNYTIGQIFERDPLHDGVLVFQRDTGDKWHSGRFEVRIKDVSKTPIRKQLGTIGSRQFEARVIDESQAELDARKRDLAPVKTWRPERSEPEEAPKLNIKINQKRKLKINITPPGQEAPERIEDRFGL